MTKKDNADTIPSPFHGLQVSRDLICEFFAVFSRFEYALKDSGWFYRRLGRVTADWRGFARHIESKFDLAATSVIGDAVTYLVADPPQIQVSARKWEARPLLGPSPITAAIDSAQRVRDNLFHGGKYTPRTLPGRDEKLIRAALDLLNACLMRDEELRASFEQH